MSSSLPPLHVSDVRVATPHGTLAARRWHVESARDEVAPLLLLHDSLGCIALWRDFPEQLARATARSVIAYDRLGFGASDPFPGALPPSFIMDEAHTYVPLVLAACGVERVVPVGHSVGGAMAVAVAAVHPGRCEALVTISAQSLVDDAITAGIRAAEVGYAAPEQFARLARYHGERTMWVLRAWIDTWLSAPFASWRLDEALRGVVCAALVLHGERDEYGAPDHAARMVSLMRGPARAVVLPEVGHFPHRERPAEVLQVIREFLAGELGNTVPAPAP